MGAWLELPAWDWYTTHTFKAQEVSLPVAERAWYSWFDSIRANAKAKGLCPELSGPGSPYYARATEFQERGTVHYHALIGGVGDIRRLMYKDFWEMNGHARVEKYEPGLGASHYLGKYLVKDDSELRLSHNLEAILHDIRHGD